MALLLGLTATVHALVHTALLEYIPFILLLLALFTVASGIVVSGNLHGSPDYEHDPARHRNHPRQPDRDHRRIDGDDTPRASRQ